MRVCVTDVLHDYCIIYTRNLDFFIVAQNLIFLGSICYITVYL